MAKRRTVIPVKEESQVRICLCMIVKNEGAIIERCLSSALPHIDTWAIVDTGSNDGTTDKIANFFRERKVPGALSYAPFKNFAQARNAALDHARSVAGWDYALLIDADMMLIGTLDKSALKAPAYMLLQQNGSLRYRNTRLVRRDSQAQYIGVTHEYVSVEGVESLDSLIIDDLNDGGSKSDKAERDIRLLNEGLIAEPQNGRYMFYLAQTYREIGRHQEAIFWYRRRIEVGGWDEEIWASHYGIAQAFKSIGDEANFVKACLDAYDYRPGRGESLKLLSKFYRETSRNEAALIIADALFTVPYPGDHLFVEKDVYDFGAKQELAIAGFYSKMPLRREAGYRACADLTIHPNGFIREEARKNFTFFARSAKALFDAEVRAIDWTPGGGWAPMNPSVFIGYEGRLVLVRTVNYTVSDGQYPTIDNSGIIRTKNYIVEMDREWQPIKSTLIEDVTGIQRSTFPVEGFEDCRLWASDSSYFVSATVRDFADSDGRCEMAIGELDSQWRIRSIVHMRNYEYEKTQKNWMPIVGRPGEFLYLCDPTITVDVGSEGHTAETDRHSAPACLTDLRGGSQLIPNGDGWLCITHEVAWRPERVYLHRFVRFDMKFQIVAISDPFFFEKVGIEFCAGLARDGSKLVASFGVNDASAHLALFDAESVNRALKYPQK